MKNQTALSAVIEGKCPRCRQGDLFVSTIFKVRSFTEMHKYCGLCKLEFEREPGFFYGALYISYVFSVAILAIAAVILYYFFDDPDTSAYIFAVVALSLFTYPLNFRLSRSVYLHLFGRVKFDEQYLIV